MNSALCTSSTSSVSYTLTGSSKLSPKGSISPNLDKSYKCLMYLVNEVNTFRTSAGFEERCSNPVHPGVDLSSNELFKICSEGASSNNESICIYITEAALIPDNPTREGHELTVVIDITVKTTTINNPPTNIPNRTIIIAIVEFGTAF